ncbi:MAG: hypothetical protein ACOC38_11295, partial [Promethearchaeia archaeon]
MEEKENAAKIRTRKNIAIGMFMIVDLVQIIFVSILTFDEQSPLVIGLDYTRSNPYSSLSVFITICLAQIVLLY